jgi:hypothetical protein
MTTPTHGSGGASDGRPRTAGSRTRSPLRRLHGASLGIAVFLALAAEAPLLWGGQDAPAPTAAADSTPSTSVSDHQDLAKKLQNPFADMITFPLQNIMSLGLDTNDGSGPGCPQAHCRGDVLNLQPVVPLHLTRNWNLLARPILPLSHTNVPDSEFGLGDLNFEPFLSPSKPASVVWGVGPILGFPTATGPNLGTGKWTAGPSLAVFVLRSPWAISLMLNQQWSYAGDSSRERVSLLQIQPTVSYILGHGFFLTSGPLISADWTKPSGQRWLVPLGAGVGKIVSIGKQKFNLQLEGYANPVRPDNGPEGLILLTVTFLFPR